MKRMLLTKHTRMCYRVTHVNIYPFQMADLQQEHHREIEGLLENIRQLSRELRLQMLIIDNFIPQEYQVCVYYCAHTLSFN